MTENRHGVDKQAYYAAIVGAVIRTDRGGADRRGAVPVIQRLAIERLQYRRRHLRPRAVSAHHHGRLMEHHSPRHPVGNHDIVWMGLAFGQRSCIAHVVRNHARYGNLSILEASRHQHPAP